MKYQKSSIGFVSSHNQLNPERLYTDIKETHKLGRILYRVSCKDSPRAFFYGVPNINDGLLVELGEKYNQIFTAFIENSNCRLISINDSSIETFHTVQQLLIQYGKALIDTQSCQEILIEEKVDVGLFGQYYEKEHGQQWIRLF